MVEIASQGDSNIANTYPNMIKADINLIVNGQGDIKENIGSVIREMTTVFALGDNYILPNGQTPAEFNSIIFNKLNNYIMTLSNPNGYVADITAFQKMFQDRLSIENYND
ncbi:MAG: hypothetical protein ABH828_03000 [archaeon]